MRTETTPDSMATTHANVAVITPEAGRSFAAFGSTAQFKLEGTHTAGRLCLGLAVTPPGGGPPPHVHHTDDEVFIVVEGQLEVWSDAGWMPGARPVCRLSAAWVTSYSPEHRRDTDTKSCSLKTIGD